MGPTLRLWQVIAGQLPWFITILSLGAWYTAKMDARLATLERATSRIEARLETDQAEQIRGMREEMTRMRRGEAR